MPNEIEEPILIDDAEPILDLDEDLEVLPYKFEITAYGADFLVDGLVNRLKNGDISIPLFGAEQPDTTIAGFQRAFVWKKFQADRFIESLLLGLPVPGIFLVKEPNGVLLVLDGHQRLATLRGFYEGLLHDKAFKLENVQHGYIGAGYQDLDPEDRRRLDNSIIHATIVRQDQPTDDQSSIYSIFERLNSGGTILQPQEIRAALYHGGFAQLLGQLNDTPEWRELYGRRSSRMKDIELILRSLALLYKGVDYEPPMKGFLNGYMSANRDFKLQSEKDIKAIFETTVKTVLAGIGAKAFKPKNTVNAAVLDSVMVGVASRIAAGGANVDLTALKGAYDTLLATAEYRTATEHSTAHADVVRTRITHAVKAFAEVP